MPRKPLPVLALLADFQQACAELGVGWYLFGAQAALLYGSPRLTADVDLTVQLGRLPTQALAQALVEHVRDVHGLLVPVAAAEDLVVMKVLAGRRKDEDDVVAVLSAQRGKLDFALIRNALRELTEALAQDDLLPTFEGLLAEAMD